MPLTMEGPRVLLRRLRQVMADRADRQTRLDKIVELIATSMNTAVCSVYLKSNEDTLELCATEGLNPSSVHKTTLKIGQGLVGDVALHARPLNLAEAKSHPRFVYLPETGEEAFQSFVGVPILSGGTVIGVLVVQNTSHRSFVDEEIEALQTVAMVLSEMLAAEGQFRAVDENLQGPARLVGYPLTEGLAIGQVVMHEPRVAVESLIAEDMDVEFSRLEAGIYELRRAVDEML
ncbi:MAG: GAF domain-containing protein, partial [Pseudomonadota bacterium]|nr:GAF domain-containing protein [Pseudomonadota bacterium]